MSNQRILGSIAYQSIAFIILLMSLYLIHEFGHLILYNLFSGTTDGRIMIEGTRIIMYNPTRLPDIADRMMRGGGLLATYPSIILLNKKTPLLGMAALIWNIYGAYEAFILGIIIPY
ncbi:MAG: hypothetical protein ACXAEE_07870 [Candidatus Thorarchaeota archaeon]